MKHWGIGVLSALALLAAACGVPLDEAPRALDPGDTPFRITGESGPAPAGGDGRVALYFVRDGQVVFQPRAVQRSTSIEELLDLLLAGPTPEQVEKGTRTELPSGLEIESVTVGSNGVAIVNLSRGANQIGTSALGIAQIVATLTAPGRARAVRFRLDGEDLRVPRGDGALTDKPVDRDDYENLLSLPSPAPSPVPSPS